MSLWGGSNRRRFPRCQYPCLVIVRHNPKSASALLTHTDNLGSGGICITLKEDLKMFAPVDLEMDLLDLGTNIKCNGKVVWSIQKDREAFQSESLYEVGIEFFDLTPKDKERLEHVVSRLEKLP